MGKSVEITEDEIEAAKTVNGGWTKEQLAKWGVPWPPPKGSKKDLLRSRMQEARGLNRRMMTL